MLPTEKEPKLSFHFETNPYQGLFICIEGLDGSGKTTQIDESKKFLATQKSNFIVTKEPNENFLMGKEIQKVLDHKRKIDSPLEFQKMYVINRQDHLEKLVIPSLKMGKIVLTDRYFWSTIAYGSLGTDKEILIKLNQNFIAPDLTIFLDVEPQKAIERCKKSRSSAEFFEKLEKLETIAQTYKWLSMNFNQQILTLNGEESETKITSQIINLIMKNQKFNQTKINENIN